MKLFAFFAILAVATADPIVEDKVYEDLAAKGTAKVILHFKGPAHSDLLAKFREEHRPLERAVHPDVLPNILEANANKHQAETLAFLKGRKLSKSSGSDFTQIWMLNQLIVHNADPGLIDELKKSNEITMIEADREYQLIDASVLRSVEDPSINLSQDPSILQTTVQWGVNDVGAPDVWAKGYRGQGITVGVIDTGIRPTHQILSSRFRASFGWLDTINKRTTAYDDQGHGTHCAGTIAGINGYGVAPNASIIACKALSSTGSGSSTGLLTCGQFMLCPTDSTGKKDCTKAPKIVSNSWGGPSTGSPTWYNKTIDSWIAQGMVAVFANGNEGSSCSTTGYPGAYSNAISVGAITSANKVATFSSRGPYGSIVKPEISAPGQDIKSAGHTSDSSYVSMSGTSMATPHIAGVAALYASANPQITHTQVLAKLRAGAKATVATGQTCGGKADSAYPNNSVGQGKVYAPAGF